MCNWRRKRPRGGFFTPAALKVSSSSPLWNAFGHDVAAPDEFAAHVQLGDRRPLRIKLDALPDRLVLEDVDTIKFHAGGVEHAADLLREAALGLLRRALHVEHDGRALDLRARVRGRVSVPASRRVTCEGHE